MIFEQRTFVDENGRVVAVEKEFLDTKAAINRG